MCGIAGLISVDRQASEEAARLQASVDAQRHRGPDDSDLQVLHSESPAVIFGHRRLAIIDTSTAGRQPMRDDETGNSIVFNGEIYNFHDVRRRLSPIHRFRTATDTEVILKAYAAWGPECVNQLRGIFAFAIWDRARQSLFMARDQLGVKPLYYWHNESDLVFASEVRALLATGLVPRHLDLHGLHSYLAYGSVQEPLTLVKEIKSLLPGHSLQWEKGKISIQRYWQLPVSGTIQQRNTADTLSEIREQLQEAVKLQMIADVPLGAFLSGGIDSTAVAALMQQTTASKVKTFAVVYNEAEYDERKYSRIAAQRIGTYHSELSLTGDLVQAELPRAIAAFDQPSVDGLNTYFVSKVTKEAGLTVALSGVGGDELFGGYSGYARTLRVMRWGRRLQALPSSMRRRLQTLLGAVAQREQVRKVVDILGNGLHPYFVSRRLLSMGQIKRLLKTDVHTAGNGWYPNRFDDLVSGAAGFDSINFASALELQTYMLSTLLRDTDQMSMAHALEVRVPLIDHKLVELMFQIPGREKVDSGVPKPLLTGALNDLIPSECIFRPKQGFTLPFEHWLREKLKGSIEKNFHDNRSDLFVPQTLEELWAQFQQARVSWARVWAIFVLSDWLSRNNVVLK